MEITAGQSVNIIVDGKPVKAEFVAWAENGAAEVLRKGKTIVRHLRDDDGRPIKPNGVVIATAKKQARFTIDQRFEFLSDYTDMTVEGDNNALIVTGEGGLGKTFTVISRMNYHGKKEKQIDEDTGEYGEGDYVIIKGATTPKALYDSLYRHRMGMIIYDDCDDALKDKKSINILKAALDSYAVRKISWLSSKEDDIPMQFEFYGKVIFMTNMELPSIPQPLRSRCIFVDVSMTRHEKFERMRSIAHQIDNGLSCDSKLELVDFLESIKEPMNELSMRTFNKSCLLVKRFPTGWKDRVRYIVTAR